MSNVKIKLHYLQIKGTKYTKYHSEGMQWYCCSSFHSPHCIFLSLFSYLHIVIKRVVCQMANFYLLFAYPSKRKHVMDRACFVLCLTIKCVVQSTCSI
jgi:hypothetical protein